MEQARELQKVLLRASNQIVSEVRHRGGQVRHGPAGLSRRSPRLPLQPLTDEHKSRISSFLATIEQPIMASA